MSTPSLDEFAEGNRPKTGPKSYLDGLPDDVQAQLLESKVGHSVAVRWLHQLGYEGATQQMVTNWRKVRGWTR